jgi:hypothetical protein
MARVGEVEEQVRHVLVDIPIAVLVAPVAGLDRAGERLRISVIAVLVGGAAVPVGILGGGVVGVRGLSGVVARVARSVGWLRRVERRAAGDAGAVSREKLVGRAWEWGRTGDEKR